MEIEMKELTLSNIAGGAAAELFKRELDAVIKNVNDPNTKADDVRKIVLEVKIKPDTERHQAAVNVSAKSTLARTKPAPSTIYFGRDYKAYSHDVDQTQFDFDNVTNITGEAEND